MSENRIFSILSNRFVSITSINLITIMLLTLLISFSPYNLENNKILAQNPDEQMAEMLEGLGVPSDPCFYGGCAQQGTNNVPNTNNVPTIIVDLYTIIGIKYESIRLN